MVDEMKKETVHQGRNVGAARYWKNFTQETLANELGMSQSQISDLEKKEKIEKPVLEKIAECMDVSLEFLETFVPQEVMKTYHIENRDFDNDFNASDQATETNVMGTIENQTVTNGIPFEAVQGLYSEIRKQERENAELRIILAKNNIEFNPSDN